MASLNMAMYDYNGSVFAFGVVRGLKNVKAVRMYLSAEGKDYAYQYYSTQIYNKDEGRINTLQNSTPCFVFYVRTDRDVEGNSPERLDYDVWDENYDGRGRYKFSFHFYNSTSSTATPINASPLVPNIGGSNNLYYQMHNSINSPKIEWDATNNKIRLYDVGKYRYMIEIRRQNRNIVNTKFSEEVKDYAYEVVMKNLESGKYWEAIPDTSFYADSSDADTDAGDKCRYRTKYQEGNDGNEPIKLYQKAIILYDKGAKFSADERAAYTSIVNSALTELSELTGIVFNTEAIENIAYEPKKCVKTVQTLVDKYGYEAEDLDDGCAGHDIIIRIGNDSTMKGSSAGGDWAGQGRWWTYRWPEWAEGGISTSIACINVDQAEKYESIRHVFFEEIYQSFGMGGDNYSQPMSIHWDPEYTNPDSYFITDSYSGICWDEEVMKFWQSQNMNGWSNVDLINKMDTPCCMFKEYTGAQYYEFDLSGLVSGEYYVYGWVAGEKSTPGAVGTSVGTSGTSTLDYWHGGWDDSPYSEKRSIEITIDGGNRPSLFAWTYPKIQGESFNLTADEWNGLTENINKVRIYKGLSAHSFTPAVKGNLFTAAMYMDARTAIREIDGYGTWIPEAAAGQTITADAMNMIVTELNAVP